MTRPSAAGRRRSDAGLTLIEMLVALTIFAAIGLAGITLLDTTLRTQRGTEGRLERMAEVDRALMVLRRDLMVAAPRGLALDAGSLSFLRETEDGPMALTVALSDEARLVRDVALSGGEPVPQRLLDEVAAIRWRVLDAVRQWQTEWPPAGGADGPPRAIELQLDLGDAPLADAARIVQLLPLPAGAAP